MSRCVIFLDIDGVLNRWGTEERVNIAYRGLDRELVNRFNELCEHTGTEVVLSSTWRLLPDFYAAVRAVILIADVTPEVGTRGEDIQAWLDANEVDRYAIIDDDRDMLPGQTTFFTDSAHGLTSEIAGAVAAHFDAPSEAEVG